MNSVLLTKYLYVADLRLGIARIAVKNGNLIEASNEIKMVVENIRDARIMLDQHRVEVEGRLKGTRDEQQPQ